MADDAAIAQSAITSVITGIGAAVGVVKIWARGLQKSAERSEERIDDITRRVTVTEAQCATCGESFARIESSIHTLSDHIERQTETQAAHRATIEREIGRLTGILAGRDPRP